MAEDSDLSRRSESEPDREPAGYLTFYDDRLNTDAQATFTIWENEIFRVGRDPQSNDFIVADDPEIWVSRNHCEVYVVVYDMSGSNHVYVRDRKSLNGTYVNDQLIGAGSQISAGFLLDDGDVIEIRPHWRFVFKQAGLIMRHDLTETQKAECRTFLDDYVLTNRCLGSGAEATVHLALHSSTGKQLVCKLVNLDDSKGRNIRDFRRRKFQETDILRQLQHPNILSYVDAVSSPHSLYTFTELASGGDLWSFLHRHDYEIAELDARIIIRQVIRGLQYLHRKGIVHRDLKPENILLAYSPKISCQRVLLSDFGASAVPKRNRMITVVGTAGYQAPEQMGDQVQTATADMWSLGMVTLALLAPLTNTELQSMSQTDQFDLNEVIEAVIARRRSPQPSYHGRAFVHHCLQRNPLERLTTQEAAKHIWLCSPRKYVEYFQLLDQKMMQSFRIQEQFRPIPWEIPQTEGMDIDRDESQSDDMPTSGYLPTKASFTPSCAAERSKFFRASHISNGCSTQESGEGLSQLTPEIFKTEPIISLTPANTPNDSGSIDGKILAKDDDASIQNQRAAETKRKREALSKTCVTTVFPRTGLGRHLEEARAKDRRMELLEELKSTNSKCFSA